jgi:ATP-binding cassette subfamily C protein CydCD
VGRPRRPRRRALVDPRLVRYARATRHFLVVTVVIGALVAGLLVAQAWLVASAVAGAVGSHQGLSRLRATLVLLVAVIAARALLGWLSELTAARASASAKSDLRRALVHRVAELGPRGVDRVGGSDLVVLAGSGIDALDAYFAKYLPQVLLAVMVPLTVVVAVLGSDWVSAAILAVTIPLIPVFMWLIGSMTKARTERQAALLRRLAGHFLDVVGGLPTLKVFGRARAQVDSIRTISDRYRSATMDTLRLTFLSSLVLELLATISVAVVAVAVGLRLLDGHLGLRSALFVLVLAPEAFWPLRSLGATYHASAEGMQAAIDIFGVLERPVPPTGARLDVPDPSRAAIAIAGLTVTYPGRGTPAISDLSLRVDPGETVAVVGPSGCGKSTLLQVLLALVAAEQGSVTVGGVDLAELDPDAWRARVAWVPQWPHLFARSIGDNIRLGRPGATDAEVAQAAARAGLTETVARLPAGLGSPLGQGGSGLSSGERQRVALARAFVRDAPLLLLDEPTANLDGATEGEVLDAVEELAAGRTAIVVAHRPSLLRLGDRVVHLASAMAGA